MTEMPLGCNPHRRPSVDDLVPAMIGALHAAERVRRFVTRFALVRRDGAWTLLSGGTTEPFAGRYEDLPTGAVKWRSERIAEVARDLIDRYTPEV